MEVVFYNLDKRTNSTKQPLPSTGTTLRVQLKEECSFMNPVLKISKEVVSGTFSPAIYNYCQIAYWERFYYINDWKYLNGVWECYCSVDPLASFRYEIGNTESYVVRCSSEYNGDIIDTYYPAQTDVNITKVNVATSWYAVAPSGGMYIVGVINNQTGNNKVGACTYYALTPSGFSSLLAYLFSDSIYWSEGIDEVGEGFFKSMFDPFQYIVSCMWFPFPAESFGNTQINMKVGYWDISVKGLVMTNLGQKTFITAKIPNHPQISRGSYLNHSPYTRITLYVPPFGEIPIDTNFLEIGNYLYCPVVIDHVTGECSMRVSICKDQYNLDEYNVVTERQSMIGVPIQISQIMPDYVNTVNSAGNAITSLLTGNILGAITGAMSAVESQMPKVSSMGSNGSFVETMLAPELIVEHYRLVEENLSEYGRPLCKRKKINTLSGYIKCGEDDHNFLCTKAESEMINTYLKNGFFYE